MRRTKVVRVSPEFYQDLNTLSQEYSKALGMNIKPSTITEHMSRRLKQDGFMDSWIRSARSKKKRRGFL